MPPGSPAGHASHPDRFALIIGAMKCGTTTLFNHLASHPEVARCRNKEPNYFSDDAFQADDPSPYFELWDWKPGRHRVALEASVNYTKRPRFPNCAERIARFPVDDFRFIYCIRNPIDRIESHVYHGQYAGWNAALDGGIPDHVIAVSQYATQLDAYASEFERERILLVVLERFEQNPERELRRVCDFLEVDSSFRFSDLAKSHNRASDHYIEHPLAGRLRGIERLRRLARRLPVGVRRSILRATGRTLEVRRELDREERGAVLEALRDDLRRLESVYGVDVSEAWGPDFLRGASDPT